MPLSKNKAWFRRKSFGFGWGLPLRWQGWAVLLVYFGALWLGILSFSKHGTGTIIGYASAITAIFLVILFWKGEAVTKK